MQLRSISIKTISGRMAKKINKDIVTKRNFERRMDCEMDVNNYSGPSVIVRIDGIAVNKYDEDDIVNLIEQAVMDEQRAYIGRTPIELNHNFFDEEDDEYDPDDEDGEDEEDDSED